MIRGETHTDASARLRSSPPPRPRGLPVRYRVLGLLVLLSVITYMDRVCIAVAAPRMREDLGLTPDKWGWVMAVFSISYGLFEIPSGAWGDRIGQRRILTRIVAWWSTFTILTGLVRGYMPLVLVRFLFGIGEAGAYPNASGSIRRWFPRQERARMQDAVWGASRLGGMLTPLVVVPLMGWLGWRAAFYVFGGLGFIWAVGWWTWYRDHPAEHPAVTPEELARIGTGGEPSEESHAVWPLLTRCPRLWLIMLMYACYAWGSTFFIVWLPEYLMKGRGLTEQTMAVFASLPFAMGVMGNLVGGVLSDRWTLRHGPRVGRRLMGAACLVVASVLLFATALVPSGAAAVVLLAICFGIMDCMLPCAWAICLDIGRQSAGAVSGAMNTGGQAGAFLCSVGFGYLATWAGGYTVPLVAIATMVFISSLLFLLIDPTRPLTPAGQVFEES